MNHLDSEDNPEETDAIFVELGQLPPDTVLTETGLARLFNKCNISIKRAVKRNELPPPTRLMGRPVWTVRAIIAHIESRLEDEARRRAQLEATVTKFQPKA